MDIREVFARNLRRLRQEKGCSQEELAHMAGLDRTYISALERSVYAATIVVVARLAEALEVAPSVLLETPRPGRKKN
ncbi:MAG TPA: helix-turn-helix transcriptional regulator [Micropepsaceae bacterium]|nr:helix-turn-helix transcriptional regulator [Micropepsaceae bacterium]